MTALKLVGDFKEPVEPGDRELVASVVTNGNEVAFRVLYRRHNPAIERALRAWGERDEDMLDDLVQETWIRATEQFSRLEWRANLRTWLVGIGFNVLRERRRRHLRDQAVPLEAAAGVASTESPVMEDGDLEQVLDWLTPELRSVFALRVVNGFSYTLIARMLGISVGAARVRFVRARRKLRSHPLYRTGGLE